MHSSIQEEEEACCGVCFDDEEDRFFDCHDDFFELADCPATCTEEGSTGGETSPMRPCSGSKRIRELEEIQDWLKNIGCGAYVAAFAEVSLEGYSYEEMLK